MAPPQPASGTRDKRLESILAFCAELPQRLRADRQDLIALEALHNEVRAQTKRLASSVLKSSSASAAAGGGAGQQNDQQSQHHTQAHDQLDRRGTELWNACTRLRRELLSRRIESGEGEGGAVVGGCDKIVGGVGGEDGEKESNRQRQQQKQPHVDAGAPEAAALAAGRKTRRKEAAVLVSSHLFALCVLHLAQRVDADAASAGALVRLLGVALKAARLAMAGDGSREEEDDGRDRGDSQQQMHARPQPEPQEAREALQRAVGYSDRLKELLVRRSLSDGEASVARTYEVQYYLLRTALAWKEDRLDVAEDMYSKVEPLRRSLDGVAVGQMADALYEIGRGLLQKGDLAMAVKWLERSYDFIASQPLDRLPRETDQLRLAIFQKLVSALLATDSIEAYGRAEDLVAFMETQMGDKQLVLMLRLELLVKAPRETFDAQTYAGILHRMARAFQPATATAARDDGGNNDDSGSGGDGHRLGNDESHFRALLHHVRALHERSPAAARAVLDELLVKRLLPSRRRDWLERALLTRAVLTTSDAAAGDDAATPDSLDSFESLLSAVQQGTDRPLGADAATAVQMLLMARVEACLGQGRVESAERWCRMAVMEIFHACGPHNLTVFNRKLMNCALLKHDFEGAKAIYHTMPGAARQENMTAYLGYKAALGSGDAHLAQTCLDSMCLSSPRDKEVLYACVMAAQELAGGGFLLGALKKLLEKYEHANPGPVHLPAAFRCIIRVTQGLLRHGDLAAEQGLALADDLCIAFEGVVEAIQRDPYDSDDNKFFTVHELDWFCSNAYNAAVTNLQSEMSSLAAAAAADDDNPPARWLPSHTLRLLDVCLRIITNHYPAGSPAASEAAMRVRALYCHFLSALCNAALARGEDEAAPRQGFYAAVCRHVDDFDEGLEVVSDEWRRRRLHQPPRPVIDLTGGGADENDEPVRLDGLLEDVRRRLPTLLVFAAEAAVALANWDHLETVLRKMDDCATPDMYRVAADALLRGDVPANVLFTTMTIIINKLWVLEKLGAGQILKYLRCVFRAILPLSDDKAYQCLLLAYDVIKDCVDRPDFPEEELQWFAAVTFNHAMDFYQRERDPDTQRWCAMAIQMAHHSSDGGALEKELHDKYLTIRFDVPPKEGA